MRFYTEAYEAYHDLVGKFNREYNMTKPLKNISMTMRLLLQPIQTTHTTAVLIVVELILRSMVILMVMRKIVLIAPYRLNAHDQIKGKP